MIVPHDGLVCGVLARSLTPDWDGFVWIGDESYVTTGDDIVIARIPFLNFLTKFPNVLLAIARSIN